MNLDNFTKILKETPLNIRLNVINEFAFIDLITELGYREEKAWTDEENETLSRLMNLAKKLTLRTLQEIQQWEQDGKPI